MTEEQKSKYEELQPLIEYATQKSGEINNALNDAQSLCDQKMYYEASQALDKISTDYKLPPTEQKKFDEEKKTAELVAIKFCRHHCISVYKFRRCYKVITVSLPIIHRRTSVIKISMYIIFTYCYTLIVRIPIYITAKFLTQISYRKQCISV